MHPARPSDTAVLIARCTLLAARDPARRALVPPEAEDPLSMLLATDTGWFGFALRHALARKALGAIERLALPGIITHYLSRKRWIETLTRREIARGVTQVVVLGAGFDLLAWRLHRELPAVRFFELDHPATQASKRRKLNAAGNLAFLPVDLAAVSPDVALRACPGFLPDQPTLVIVEGLLMYFSEDRVTALLGELAGLVRPHGSVLFTFMGRSPDGSISFRAEHAAVGWWLRWRREPFRWGIAPGDLPDFLRGCGLKVMTLADHDTLRAEILAPLGCAELPLARGECLCHSVPAAR